VLLFWRVAIMRGSPLPTFIYSLQPDVNTRALAIAKSPITRLKIISHEEAAPQASQSVGPPETAWRFGKRIVTVLDELDASA
jgi:hypothetical protein